MDAQNHKNRLLSLDALRGFDMFWIIGGSSIADGLVNLNLPWSRVIAHQLSHSKWNGFTFYDLIFPLFVYITGVSVYLSLQKRLKTVDRKSLVKHVLKRSAILFLIGIIYYDQISTLSLAQDTGRHLCGYPDRLLVNNEVCTGSGLWGRGLDRSRQFAALPHLTARTNISGNAFPS
ncbi:MAG TPA: hypothetical protein DD811_13935 [Syntrophomonas sp.]|jgi:hypothetical protein|nr:hypothetical protein [Syntrophomonas sp.]